ncbi:hypothetical protein KSP40_PGU011318 [Platanthera guangdongensis]|uniref:Uncharacterized protein n=1 Tax=Platanthera guangdongensis TaxID=2320717 RepID=A0ABR2MHM6_9ASPA
MAEMNIAGATVGRGLELAIEGMELLVAEDEAVEGSDWRDTTGFAISSGLEVFVARMELLVAMDEAGGGERLVGRKGVEIRSGMGKIRRAYHIIVTSAVLTSLPVHITAALAKDIDVQFHDLREQFRVLITRVDDLDPSRNPRPLEPIKPQVLHHEGHQDVEGFPDLPLLLTQVPPSTCTKFFDVISDLAIVPTSFTPGPEMSIIDNICDSRFECCR